MQLINKETAYKVLSEYYHHTGTLQHMALKEALDRVPTVDAIPVRWLKNKQGKHTNDGFAWIYGEIINEWKTRQEKQNETD